MREVVPFLVSCQQIGTNSKAYTQVCTHKTRIEHPAHPSTPQNRENLFLRMAIPKICRLQSASFAVTTLDLHHSSLFQLQIWPHMQTFLLPATLANGILLNTWQHNCIPRSCDLSVNMHHVQSPLERGVQTYPWNEDTSFNQDTYRKSENFRSQNIFVVDPCYES